MKEGWTIKKIGDICSITDFVSNGSFASLRENVKYYNSPNYAVLIRLADASNGFEKSKFVYTDEHGYNFSKKSHLHGGELIMSNVGSVGSMFICPVMTQPMTLAPNTISITSQNNRFLYYYFLSDGFKLKLNGITSSTTLKKFNKTNFKLLDIAIPSLSEQQSIVDYLDSAFAKIDAMKANAEKALNEAKALFQASLKEMLEPKEGWEECFLKDIAKYSIGLTYKPSDVCDDGTIVLRSSNIQGGKLDLNDKVRVNTKIKEELYVQNGDILMCSRNGSARLVGKVCIIPELKEKMTYGTFMMVIRSAYNPLLYHYFDTGLFRSQIKHGEANMINQITRYMLDDVKLFIPPLSEQQSIVAALDSLKSKVDQLQANFEKISQECDALKQAILKQVFE